MPKALVDYMNTGFIFSANKKIRSGTVNFSIKKSEYKNRINELYNSNNFSWSTNVSSALSKSTKITAGINSNNVKHPTGLSDVRSEFYKTGFSFHPRKSRFAVSHNRNWNFTSGKTTTKVFSSNSHMSWDLKPNLWKFIFNQNGTRSLSPSSTSKKMTSSFEFQYSLNSRSIVSLQYKKTYQSPIALIDRNIISSRYLLSF